MSTLPDVQYRPNCAEATHPSSPVVGLTDTLTGRQAPRNLAGVSEAAALVNQVPLREPPKDSPGESQPAAVGNATGIGARRIAGRLMTSAKVWSRALCARLVAWRGFPRWPSSSLLYMLVEQRRADLKRRISETLGYTVAFGPFKGLTLPMETSWLDGDTTAKLLGCYEQELHPWLAQLLSRQPEVIVNVGCADGYYAIGLARLTNREVHAIDIDRRALEVCAASARENAVRERLKLSADSSTNNLRAILDGRKGMVVMDCEGAEFQLLAPDLAPALASCDLLIECHDFCAPGGTRVLSQRFQATHKTILVEEGERDPNKFASLRHLPSLDRWIAISEGRPETMHWLICLANNRE